MRICLVSEEYPPETARGGIGTQTWHKAHGLTRRGHAIEVLSCLPPRCATGPGVRTEERDGVVVHRMLPPAEGGEARFPLYEPAAYSLGYSWRVLETLERIRRDPGFDLVNFPEFGGEGFAYQMNRTRWNWTPVVVHLHGPLAMFTERVGWPDRESRHHRLGSFMEGESMRLADGLLASSANIADFSARHYGIDRDAVEVVHCGIDAELFRPLPAEARGDRPPTVLFAGNVEANKGVKTVFEAVLRLRERVPRLRLRILGKGGGLGEELRRRARSAGADVEFLGFVAQREDLPKIYREADVFASPADHEPGVANVYVEAMACGLPVVAARSGGAPEAVAHEETGLLVAPRDVEATAAALMRILTDAALAARLGRAGRDRVECYFAMDRYLDRVLRGYERALERSREERARLEADTGEGAP